MPCRESYPLSPHTTNTSRNYAYAPQWVHSLHTQQTHAYATHHSGFGVEVELEVEAVAVGGRSVVVLPRGATVSVLLPIEK